MRLLREREREKNESTHPPGDGPFHLGAGKGWSGTIHTVSSSRAEKKEKWRSVELSKRT